MATAGRTRVPTPYPGRPAPATLPDRDVSPGAGAATLARQVRWAARDDGDGLGYDVLSFDAHGRHRYIEVKTTALGAPTPFYIYISSAELEFARAHPGSFALHRVYDLLHDPHFYVLDGDITEAADLVPVTYRAQLKSGPGTSSRRQAPDNSRAGRGSRQVNLSPGGVISRTMAWHRLADSPACSRRGTPSLVAARSDNGAH